MKKTFKNKRTSRIRRVPKDCMFCKQKVVPNYKEIETLGHFVTERGKIRPRAESGICQKHQKSLTLSVKQARFMAILPYIVRPS